MIPRRAHLCWTIGTLFERLGDAIARRASRQWGHK